MSEETVNGAPTPQTQPLGQNEQQHPHPLKQTTSPETPAAPTEAPADLKADVEASVPSNDAPAVAGAGQAIDGRMDAELEEAVAPNGTSNAPTAHVNGNATHEDEAETLPAPISPEEAVEKAKEADLSAVPTPQVASPKGDDTVGQLPGQVEPISAPSAASGHDMAASAASVPPPDAVPPPPIVPPPTALELPAMQRAGSQTSLAANPPTPTTVGASAPAEPSATAAPPVESQPADSQPASAAATPPVADSQPQAASQVLRDVQMNDSSESLKRSAPNDDADAAEAKRPKLDSETVSQQPTPVDGPSAASSPHPVAEPAPAATASAPPSLPTVAAGSSVAPDAAPVAGPSGAPAASSSTSAPVRAMTRDQQKYAMQLLRALKKNRSAPPFLKPVDYVALLIPDYPKVITQPMDLGTIESKLNSTSKAMTNAQKLGKTYGVDYTGTGEWQGKTGRTYRTADDLKADFDLVWENCFRYNGPKERNPVSMMAASMQEVCEKMWKGMPEAPLVEYRPDLAPPPAPAPVAAPSVPRRASAPVPVPRRSEDLNRPKREIHAPSRDLPYESTGRSNAKLSNKAVQEQLRFCKDVIREMFKKTHEAYAFPFYHPVDPVALNIPNYLQIVKKPIDLTTIKNKVESGAYPAPAYGPFEEDMRLLFKNCYIFNPAGTPVHDMGRKLEAVFDRKWEQRPMAPEYEEESDEEGITAMERQLEQMRANLDALKANKRAKKEADRAARGKPGKKSAGGAPRPAGPSAARKRASMSGAVPKKPKKRQSSEDFVDQGPQEVTFEMKRELAVKIVSFEGENLEKAIDIIRQGRPDLLADANKEIELDIDQLDPATLLRLYRFVCPPPVQQKPKVKRQQTKRKSLDEMKEAERIEALEARLRQFDNTAQPAAADAAAPGAGASSESSSEDGSDSETGDEF